MKNLLLYILYLLFLSSCCYLPLYDCPRSYKCVDSGNNNAFCDVYKTDSISVNLQLEQYSFARIGSDSLSYSVKLSIKVENNSSVAIVLPMMGVTATLYDRRNSAKQTLGKLGNTEPEFVVRSLSNITNDYVFSFTYANTKDSRYNKKNGIRIQIPYILVEDEKISLPMVGFVW